MHHISIRNKTDLKKNIIQYFETHLNQKHKRNRDEQFSNSNITNNSYFVSLKMIWILFKRVCFFWPYKILSYYNNIIL